MSYYMGDFYQGDYRGGHRGDPFWGAALGKLFSAGKSLLGMGGGTSAGALESAMSRAITKMPGGGLSGMGGQILRRAGGTIAKHPILTGAAAAGTIGLLGGGGVGRHMGLAAGQAGMKGHHINKRGQVVRNRHMRVTNPKALRRAIRRASGFAKLAMKTIHLVHPRKKGRFGGFKKKRSR